jgi:hypothetical protein
LREEIQKNENFLLTNFQTHAIIDPSSEGKHLKTRKENTSCVTMLHSSFARMVKFSDFGTVQTALQNE